MQTSLRYGGETRSKTLKLHAKQRIYLDSNTILQGHAELDTYVGIPSYLALFVRHFHPESLTNAGVGVQCDRNKSLGYNVRGKKEFLMNSSGDLRFVVKGRCNVDKEFSKYKPRAAAELCLYKFEFQKDQDLRLKVGYEMFEKVPYFQICETTWTVNFDMNGARSMQPKWRDIKRTVALHRQIIGTKIARPFCPTPFTFPPAFFSGQIRQLPQQTYLNEMSRLQNTNCGLSKKYLPSDSVYPENSNNEDNKK